MRLIHCISIEENTREGLPAQATLEGYNICIRPIDDIGSDSFAAFPKYNSIEE